MSRKMVNGLALLGLVLLLIGGVTLWQLSAWATEAIGLDEVSGANPDIPLSCPDLTMSTNLPRRVMSENESQSLTVALSLAGEVTCEVTLTLLAPDFVVSPAQTVQVLSMSPGDSVIQVWVLQPQRLGTFAVVVSSNRAVETLGLTVTNVLGMTAAQARILSAVGTFLGPMLTAPWWYEQWKERQKKKEEEVRQAAEAEAKRKAAAEKKGQAPGRDMPFE
ncbi:MAG: hypothetical protein H6666_07090 [Ardenticatenaceae bacterium]|nr:hypothetical protein [Ardenticatenaceae bacterium]